MDTISNFITTIRNAYAARKDKAVGLYSKAHLRIAEILRDEGFLREVRELTDDRGRKHLELTLKYVNDQPALTGIKRVSTPGRRVYKGYGEFPRVLNGLGMAIVTTSKGILRDREAKAQKVGGELLCTVW